MLMNFLSGTRARRETVAAAVGGLVVLLVFGGASAQSDEGKRATGAALAGTELLTLKGDIAEQMVSGVDRFLLKELERSVARRGTHWTRDVSSPAAYDASVEPNRQRLGRMIGISGERVRCELLELLASVDRPALVGRGEGYEIFAVRWRAEEGLHGEGLWLKPTGKEPVASVVAIGDCGQTPEMLVGLAPGVAAESQFARRLAENGCQVLVPILIDRGMGLSVIADGQRTGQVTHREILYRSAYQMGRHLIGYEVQKVLAAVDWLAHDAGEGGAGTAVVGYGEGGLVALYAGALDRRVEVVGVSGYFGSRQEVWREPIDRNVFGLLAEFGDAELASLIAPRTLVVETCRFPDVHIPAGIDSAPAQITTPTLRRVAEEMDRARETVAGLYPQPRMELVVSGDGSGSPGTENFVTAVLEGATGVAELAPSREPPSRVAEGADADARLARQFREISDFSQRLVDAGPSLRQQFTAGIDRETGDISQFAVSTRPYRDHLRSEIIGHFDDKLQEPNPRTRLAYDEPEFRGYEVVLDVVPDVIFYGVLLLPKDLLPDEKRPVVVCQHGLEGRAQDVIEGDRTSYRDFAARLARRGFIVFAPQHLYRGGDQFRSLQRKANPLGKSLFAVMVMQHEQLLNWLSCLPHVDPHRIGFYGISYGGKSAMRIPALVDRYCLSICSSDYSDWIWRTVSNRFDSGYLAHGEYEIFEFGLGCTFNYGDLAALICPRPFMVERFHRHGMIAERILAEYARASLLYENLEIADRTRIAYFGNYRSDSEHGQRETFAFLHEQLEWPRRTQ